MELGRAIRRPAAAALMAWVLVAGTLAAGLPARAAPVALEGCVVDSADMIGWWRGEDDLLAAVGDDLAGSVGFADAVSGRGFELGSGDSLRLSTLPAVSNGVTVEGWIRPSSSLFSQALFSRWTFVGGSSDDAFALVLTTDGLIFYVDEQSLIESDTLSVSAPQLYDGSFHHVAATWGNGQMALYVDGSPVAERSVRGGTINQAQSTTFTLGETSDPGFLRYQGAIDEPTVYDRALTPTEVAAIDAAGAAGKCTPSPPNTQIGKLFDEQTGSDDDWYGRSVDLDHARAVIGVPGDDPGGSARVLTRSGTTWSIDAVLVGTDTVASDRFGFSVAIDGDTAVIGAFEDDHGQFINRGSVYVFVRDGMGAWSQQAKLVPSQSSNVLNFGRAVDISGDTVVVGALNDDSPGALDSGAVYVFNRSVSSWTQQARLTASDAQTGDGLGFDVAIEGDTLLAGADMGDDDVRGQSDSGAAYVFTRSGPTWTEAAKLTASDSQAGDALGFAVALDGGSALVGAHTAGSTTAGAAYIFTGSGATWSEQAILVDPGGAFGDRFGFDVTIDGELAVIGARLDDDPLAGADAGSAHVFVRDGTTWTHVARLNADDAAASDEFGSAVASRSGFALIGAYRDDEAGLVDRGSVYVFGTSGG